MYISKSFENQIGLLPALGNVFLKVLGAISLKCEHPRKQCPYFPVPMGREESNISGLAPKCKTSVIKIQEVYFPFG